MSAFLKWLAPRIEGLKGTLKARQEELRQGFLKSCSHSRVPDIAASILVGLEVFLEFARDAGGLSAEESKELEARARDALAKAALAQAEFQESEESALRFLALIVASLASGRSHLADAETGEAPTDAKGWGWRQREVGTGENTREELIPLGTCVGWIEGEAVYLDPESAFAAAQRLAAEQGTSLAVTARTLWKRLAERGYLASRDLSRGKNCVRRTVAGKRREVLHLSIRTLRDVPTISGPIGPIGPEANKDKDLGRDFLGPESKKGESRAQNSGPRPEEGGPIGPIGPEKEGRVPWEEGTI